MAKVLVVYSTRSGNTRIMAQAIGEGVRLSGHEPTLVDVKAVKGAQDLHGYDGYIFGSATYHGEMMEAMKTMLFIAEKAGMEGKAGGAFGAYGWSGEAPERIYATMKNIFKLNMVDKSLKQKSPGTPVEKKMAQDYGREVGRKLGV